MPKIKDLGREMPPAFLWGTEQFRIERLTCLEDGNIVYQVIERRMSMPAGTPLMSTAGLQQLGIVPVVTDELIVVRTLSIEAYAKELQRDLVIEWKSKEEKEFYAKCYEWYGCALTLAMIIFPELAILKVLDHVCLGIEFVEAVEKKEVKDFLVSFGVKNIGGYFAKRAVPAAKRKWEYAAKDDRFAGYAKNVMEANAEAAVGEGVKILMRKPSGKDFNLSPTQERVAVIHEFRLQNSPTYAAQVKAALKKRDEEIKNSFLKPVSTFGVQPSGRR